PRPQCRRLSAPTAHRLIRAEPHPLPESVCTSASVPIDSSRCPSRTRAFRGTRSLNLTQSPAVHRLPLNAEESLMTQSLNNLQPLGALVMRLALGVSMSVHGYEKVIPHGALNHYVHYIIS